MFIIRSALLRAILEVFLIGAIFNLFPSISKIQGESYESIFQKSRNIKFNFHIPCSGVLLFEYIDQYSSAYISFI